jgi:CDP-glucose 4,6-dehydratase
MAFQPDIVFHLAAQPLVRCSYENPADTFAINVMGSVNVMDAIRAVPSCRTVVMVTSDKCYENQEWMWGYRETDRLGGHDPYSASKAAAEIAVSSYRRSFFRPAHKGIATARAGNVIGGGDWCPDRLIPDCIRALERCETITLRNPGATRPWQHVLEPVSGYMKLAERLHADPPGFDDAWNFGPDPAQVYTVQQVVELGVKNWGSGRCETVGGSVQHEAGLLALDISKARQKLGWSPAWNTPRAVEETMKWYRDARKGDAYDFCVQQISAYEKGCK